MAFALSVGVGGGNRDGGGGRDGSGSGGGDVVEMWRMRRSGTRDLM